MIKKTKRLLQKTIIMVMSMQHSKNRNIGIDCHQSNATSISDHSNVLNKLIKQQLIDNTNANNQYFSIQNIMAADSNVTKNQSSSQNGNGAGPGPGLGPGLILGDLKPNNQGQISQGQGDGAAKGSGKGASQTPENSGRGDGRRSDDLGRGGNRKPSGPGFHRGGGRKSENPARFQSSGKSNSLKNDNLSDNQEKAGNITQDNQKKGGRSSGNRAPSGRQSGGRGSGRRAPSRRIADGQARGGRAPAGRSGRTTDGQARGGRGSSRPVPDGQTRRWQTPNSQARGGRTPDDRGRGGRGPSSENQRRGSGQGRNTQGRGGGRNQSTKRNKWKGRGAGRGNQWKGREDKNNKVSGKGRGNQHYNNKNKKGFLNQRFYNQKREKQPIIPKGIVGIKSTFNNTIITVSNLRGKVIGWSSAGISGFKGSRKATGFAAKSVAALAARKAIDNGLKQSKVTLKGVGRGRDNALRSLSEAGLEITVIRDITGIPHNGCRPKKKRRV